ncbi:uncharacterized protein [Panulirus ornatus]|uniref:uncharacterized protein n=1 Tax=Panulirus ornatus TaxID=150431 RepID=UPI003A874EE7
MKRPSPSLLLVTILLQAATSIRVESVVVPPVVLAGRRVKLECQYREEGDKLYSLKWWRGDDQFYQYIPPTRKHFPVTGVNLNWTATSSLNRGNNGQEVVVLERVGLDTAGVYKCEVMADINFQTEYRQANMTVIYAPEGPPTITSAPGMKRDNITAGQLVILTCTSPPASPPPALTWFLNERHVDPTWVRNYSPVFQRNLARTKSRLEFTVSDEQVSSGREMSLKCVASQGGVGGGGGGSPEHIHNYKQSAYYTLKPAQPRSFWGRIFSGGSGVHVCFYHHQCLLLLLIIALLLPAALTTTTIITC